MELDSDLHRASLNPSLIPSENRSERPSQQAQQEMSSCGSSKEHAIQHHIAPQLPARFGLQACSGQLNAGLGASERQSRICVQLHL